MGEAGKAPAVLIEGCLTTDNDHFPVVARELPKVTKKF
jgi:hypothetical protein